MQQNLLQGTNKAKFFNDFIKQYPPRKLGFILILYLCYFWHTFLPTRTLWIHTIVMTSFLNLS